MSWRDMFWSGCAEAGTIGDHDGAARRAFIRFFACEQDLSHQPPDTPLPSRGPISASISGGWRAG